MIYYRVVDYNVPVLTKVTVFERLNVNDVSWLELFKLVQIIEFIVECDWINCVAFACGDKS